MRLPDFEAWAMFSAVAEHRSFTEAARAMSVSKATVSKAITRLEQHLDTSLFSRTSRRLTLTESGRRLADHASRIMEQGLAAEEAAREEITELAGIVRLGAPMSFGLTRVAPILAEFMALHPAIVVDLNLSDERIDLVESGLDATLRIAAMPDSSLRARRLCDIFGHYIASPSYLERKGIPKHPSDLSDHDGILYTNISNPETWRFARPDGETVAVQPKARMMANSGEAMLPALRAGVGIAYLPDFIIGADLANGTLVSILEDWRPPAIGLHLVTPPSRLRPARVEACLEYLVQSLAR